MSKFDIIDNVLEYAEDSDDKVIVVTRAGIFEGSLKQLPGGDDAFRLASSTLIGENKDLAFILYRPIPILMTNGAQETIPSLIIFKEDVVTLSYHPKGIS